MTSILGGSAQIYEFPSRGRFALNGRDESQLRADIEAPLVKVASGSGWYHAAAIEEAEHSRGK
jgi:hypothetical protein